jgi:DNA-binding beta-propeller fold protein YncE
MRKLFATIFAAALSLSFAAQAADAPAAKRPYPKHELDASWPKQFPNNMIMGDPAGVAVDPANDHVWVLSRQRSVNPEYLGLTKSPPTSRCCTYMPAVAEFDAEGNYIQGWGGPMTPTPDAGAYEWPEGEHGITVDYKGNVWICGYVNNREAKIDDNHCIKFTKDGRFLLQIGKKNASKGSLDTENLNHATKVVVDPKTNEAYIADGYVNRRVIVVDADSGKFKRMWGAYGNKPDDSAPRDRTFDGPPSQQFNNVHGIELSNDGLVYVNDRQNNRVQVFNTQGKFLKEVFILRDTKSSFGTSFSLALSSDKEQKFVYVADLANFRVHVLDRKSMEMISEASFGHAGPYPGQFLRLHLLASDTKGNIYTSEANGGKINKWVFKGIVQ